MRWHSTAEVVYRAKVTAKFTKATVNFAEGAENVQYAGVYARRQDAVSAGTRLKRYWGFRDDIHVTVEIEESTLDWKPSGVAQ